MLMLVMNFRCVSMGVFHGLVNMSVTVLAFKFRFVMVCVVSVAVVVLMLVGFFNMGVAMLVLFRDRKVSSNQHNQQCD